MVASTGIFRKVPNHASTVKALLVGKICENTLRCNERSGFDGGDSQKLNPSASLETLLTFPWIPPTSPDPLQGKQIPCNEATASYCWLSFLEGKHWEMNKGCDMAYLVGPATFPGVMSEFPFVQKTQKPLWRGFSRWSAFRVKLHSYMTAGQHTNLLPTVGL